MTRRWETMTSHHHMHHRFSTRHEKVKCAQTTRANEALQNMIIMRHTCLCLKNYSCFSCHSSSTVCFSCQLFHWFSLKPNFRDNRAKIKQQGMESSDRIDRQDERKDSSSKRLLFALHAPLTCMCVIFISSSMTFIPLFFRHKNMFAASL